MNAVIYARVSSLGDRQNTERQISDLKQYAAYQNLEISRILKKRFLEQNGMLKDLFCCRLLTTASKTKSQSY